MANGLSAGQTNEVFALRVAFRFPD